MRIIFILVMMNWVQLNGQSNCDFYKGDPVCYQACLEAARARYQASTREAQQKFDETISACPSLDFAYAEKAEPYLRNGDFVTWKKLIDQAVAINPEHQLGTRAWGQFHFLHDYAGALQDINQLDSLLDDDLGYSRNKEYHLNVLRALCYKGLGDPLTAIRLIEDQLQEDGYRPRLYDYLHLGVLKMETGDYAGANDALERQVIVNDRLAEVYYYLAITQQRQRNMIGFRENLLKAKTLYSKNLRRTDEFSEPVDKIYFSDIEKELPKLPK